MDKEGLLITKGNEHPEEFAKPAMDKRVVELVDYFADWLLEFHERMDNHSEFSELYYKRSARELLSGDPDLCLIDDNQSCKIQRLGSDEYIDTTFSAVFPDVRRVIPLSEALEEK